MQKIQVKQEDGYYSCEIGISKGEWLAILKDRQLKDSMRKALLGFYYMPGHRGTCTAVGKQMGKNARSLNNLIRMFGQRVQKIYRDRFEVVGTDDRQSFWIVPMNRGRKVMNMGEGVFEWELRGELVDAIRDYLYWHLVERYKQFRREVPIDQEGRGYERYKWQLITASQGKTPIQILADHVAHTGKAQDGGFENLIDASRDNKSMKYLMANKAKEYEKILNGLADEGRPLDERLADFKSSMAALLPKSGYGSKANDERTAATILTCLYPDKYTFYKHDGLYANFCLYLGVEMQKAGHCYSHYLALIQPLAELVSGDDELQKIVSPSLHGMKKSNMLLAQDILYVMMVTFQSRLGYIYNLLYKTENDMDDDKINEYIRLLEANHNLILTGAPGTGKTYLAKQIAAKMIGLDTVDELEGNEQLGFVQFHPSYDYTDFVEGIRPRFDGGDGFELRDGVFKEFCAKAIDKNETKGDSGKYVFVIDEINRGELSKIFGELFFSIDPGYRGLRGMVKTQYQNMVVEGDVFDKGFYIPENIYIIGTMNDIDRSVESMDFAMRRRFAWREVTAAESQAMLDDNVELEGAPIAEIKARMDNLNAAIVGKYRYKDGKERMIPGLNQSFQIGAAYFAKYANYMDDDNPFEALWKYHLKGLLAEYLRGNADVENELDMLKEAYDDETDSDNGQ